MTHLLIPALALLAAHRAQTPPPLAYVVVTEFSACVLGGTAAQATAIAKAPAFAGWTAVSESWAVSATLPAGVAAPDPATVLAAWNASPATSFRAADLSAGSIGTLPPSDAALPSLPLSGGDQTLGLQLRFRIRKRAVACPVEEAQGLVAAVYGRRRAPFQTVGRWDAAAQSLTGWGTPVVSSAWPKL